MRIFGSDAKIYHPVIITGLIVFLITSITSKGFHHPDEHYQILEYASYKLGNATADELTWEFQDKIRPGLQPYLALGCIKVFQFLGLNSPFTQAFLLRLLVALLAWWLITKTCLLLLDKFQSIKARKYFLGISLLLWFIPYVHVRFSSEVMGGLAMLAGVYLLLLKAKPTLASLLFSGFLFGISFYLRFQMAFAFVGIGLWLIFIRKSKWLELAVIFTGGLIALGIGVLIDHNLYGSWEFTPWNYYVANIVKGKAAEFGTMPFWDYIPLTVVHAVPPIGVALLLLIAIGVKKAYKDIFVYILLSFLVLHSVVGHKEMRFLFPVIFAATYLAALGLDWVFIRYSANKFLLVTLKILVVLNFALLASRSLAPKEAIHFYKYAYELGEEQAITILSIEKSFYNLVGNETNFYKSPNVTNIVFRSHEEIEQYLQANTTEDTYLFNRELCLDYKLDAFETRRVYAVFPDWILKFNINNWQERTRMWSLHKVVGTGGD